MIFAFEKDVGQKQFCFCSASFFVAFFMGKYSVSAQKRLTSHGLCGIITVVYCVNLKLYYNIISHLIFTAKGVVMETLDLGRLKKQKLLIILCCLVYGFAYAGRYSYSANIDPLKLYYGISNEAAGSVSTFFFISYGLGQLLNALFCKYYPKRYVVAGALGISAVINLSLFFLPPFEYVKYLWLLNGVCQSVLWPSLMLTIGEVVDPSLTKRAVLTMSFSVVLGTVLAYGGSSLFNLFESPTSFRYAFLLGVVFPALIGVVWLLSYNTLTKVKYQAVPSATSAAETKQNEPSGKRAMIRSMVGLLAVCAVFAAVDNFVKDGLNTWTPVILGDQFGFDESKSIILTLVLPIFGVFGSVTAMNANKILKDFRGLIGAFYLVLSLCLLGVTWAFGADNAFMTLVFFGLISLLTHGINSVLTSIMPLALRDRVNSGFLSGLMNACCYVGSAASAYGLGKMADGESWDFVIRVLMVACAAATILAGAVMLLMVIRSKKTVDGGNEI